MMNDLFEHLHQPSAYVLRKIMDNLPEHRLCDDELANHVDDAIDFFQFDPCRRGAVRCRFRRRGARRRGLRVFGGTI